ncbi:hypothetical protein THIOSC13_460006 [uncultured Thiomicrorhabdus sp.]
MVTASSLTCSNDIAIIIVFSLNVKNLWQARRKDPVSEYIYKLDMASDNPVTRPAQYPHESPSN